MVSEWELMIRVLGLKNKWMGYIGGDGNELGFWFLFGVLELLTLCE